MAHLALENETKFDFQKYIKRSLEDDFKVVIGISPIIWFIAVLFLLAYTHGWYSYLWLPFIPLIYEFTIRSCYHEHIEDVIIRVSMGVIIQFLFSYVTHPLYALVTQFTEEAGQFNGLDVLGDGNAAVIKYLDEKLSIIMEESYEHKYLYDWRTKKPTIFRATEQWFASMEGFHQAAMDAIGHVKWIPAKMEDFKEKERELRTSSLTRKQPNTGSKETSLDEVLCRHKERKPFAYGLCNECYEEFMKVSGGLNEGSDPSAFQSAEKERLAKLSI